MANARKLFVNLPVRDLKKSMEFFSKLGFEYNRQFTDDNAACMPISEEAFVMLLTEPFFKSFTQKQLCDTSVQNEGLICFTCSSRAEVDDIVKRAIAAGGTHAAEAKDYGFMYGWSFYDLDGHHWELCWMDPQHIQPTH